MISVYQLKTKFQGILRPICNMLAERGVTANQVTLGALGLSVFYGILLCLNVKFLWLFLPVILFIRMALNAIDGMLAREHNMKSKLGMALNELGDVLADTALFVPFVFFAPQAVWIIATFIFIAVMTEMCGLIAFMMSGTRRYDGPMGKSDRAFAVGLLGVLIGWEILTPPFIGAIFFILSVLAIWACVNRIQGAIKDKEI